MTNGATRHFAICNARVNRFPAFRFHTAIWISVYHINLNINDTMKSTILATVAATVVLIGTVVILNNSITKTERIECLTWQAQSTEYPQWYATDWQIAQCSAYGITL